jgi:hypothetical protein
MTLYVRTAMKTSNPTECEKYTRIYYQKKIAELPTINMHTEQKDF